MISFSEMLQKYKYLVINKHENCKMYASLRDISRDIGVDFTTISKKLKTNPEYCICQAKITKESYCIRRL
jgi:hypothetical protein